MREPGLPAGQNSLDIRSLAGSRYCPQLCRQPLVIHLLFIPAPQPPPANALPPGLTGQRSSGCFLYMAQRFPAANIFHSGISRPAISRRPIFLYRANLSLSLATTFCQGAFGADLNLTASNLSLSFSIFFLFFLFFIFLVFLLLSVFFAFFHILYHPIYRIFIFPYFFCGFPQKTASITGCCKISCAVFFWRFYTKDFMHINIEITNTQQRKE